MTIVRIGETRVAVSPGHVVTYLNGGRRVDAVPHNTSEYAATAGRLGYGKDVERLNRDHELTHSLLADWLGLQESPVMCAVAEDVWADDPTGRLALEEEAVCAVQRLAMAWGVDLLKIAEEGKQ